VIISTAAPKLGLSRPICLLLLAGAAVTDTDVDAGGVIPALDILQVIGLSGVAWVTPSISILDFVIHFCQVIELVDAHRGTFVKHQTGPAADLIAAATAAWVVPVGICNTGRWSSKMLIDLLVVCVTESDK
jgi:hypothetical protein